MVTGLVPVTSDFGEDVADAADALKEVAEYNAARIATLTDLYVAPVYESEDYSAAPGFGAAQKKTLADNSGAATFEAEQTISETMQSIYETKKAYLDLYQASEKVYTKWFEHAGVNRDTADKAEEAVYEVRDNLEAGVQAGSAQQELRSGLGLGGGDPQGQPRGPKPVQKLPDPREGPALIDPHGDVALPEIENELLRLGFGDAVDLHEFLDQRRAREAAQPLQGLLPPVLSQGVLDAFRDPLHRIEHGPVKIEQHGLYLHFCLLRLSWFWTFLHRLQRPFLSLYQILPPRQYVSEIVFCAAA